MAAERCGLRGAARSRERRVDEVVPPAVVRGLFSRANAGSVYCTLSSTRVAAICRRRCRAGCDLEINGVQPVALGHTELFAYKHFKRVGWRPRTPQSDLEVLATHQISGCSFAKQACKQEKILH